MQHYGIGDGVVMSHLVTLGNSIDIVWLYLFQQEDGNASVVIVLCEKKEKKTITTEAFPSSAGKDNPESTTESITGNQASTTKSTTGIKQTQNIVYISCGVGFFLILSCSIASFHVGKKYQSAQINKKSGRNQFININNGTEVERDAQMSPNIATSRGNGQDDAEIDELEMPDLS
ncbi:Hypothetical predicted protein [Mytilus galloprovincialis]|uniref:Uncharacterized protein n=1 Tax=Mytilus galloprovincialis TaxID=29158 RepID=A0A8B6DQD1_MYTGA|nr:Hypothetical predicted protein [Mytilus galloprovincialis]